MIAKPTGMNAIIAEHVFGWKWDKHWAGGCWIIPERYRDWDSGEPQVSPPNFTEDIADAWLVVEKLKERQRIAQDGDASDPIWVRFVWNLQMSKHGVHAMLFNLTPETICKAALKACGVEVE